MSYGGEPPHSTSAHEDLTCTCTSFVPRQAAASRACEPISPVLLYHAGARRIIASARCVDVIISNSSGCGDGFLVRSLSTLLSAEHVSSQQAPPTAVRSLCMSSYSSTSSIIGLLCLLCLTQPMYNFHTLSHGVVVGGGLHAYTSLTSDWDCCTYSSSSSLWSNTPSVSYSSSKCRSCKLCTAVPGGTSAVLYL